MMKSSTAPRRVYPRSGSLVICYAGMYFGPKANSASVIPDGASVRCVSLPASHGKRRLEVKARVGGKTITETWIQTPVVFKARA